MSLTNLNNYIGGWYWFGLWIGCLVWFMEDLARVCAGKKDNAALSRMFAGALTAALLIMASNQ